MYIIKLENVTKKFKNKVIFDKLNYDFQSGTRYGIVGANGTGKSVLFKMLTGLMYPNQGQIIVGETILKDGKIPQDLGALIESPGFISDFSAFDNLKILASIKGKISDKELIDTLEMVGLLEDKDSKVKTFSMGMLQRLGIAQAIMEKPKILILDEPFNSMDIEGVETLRKAINDYVVENKITLLLTSHNEEDIKIMTDRVLKIQDNKLVEI